MADNDKKSNANDSGAEPQYDRIISQRITDEMKDAYLDYAMSVIVARALPDVRDGLKPVHRRILYTMNELNLSAGAKTRKSAKITGDVTGNYHPHGDTSVYDAMVKLGQPFSMRYPMVIGQGNFGSIDGDPPAASRYTEAKMSKIAAELLTDIGKDTVDFRPNYEGTRREPTVLPAAVPNLLLNGALGIAVGMATNIPPHNLTELINALVYMIDNDDASTEDLLQFVTGPDFPTGGIIFNKEKIRQAYTTGRGGVVCRGEAEIVEDKRGTFQIVISSIPYRVNKSDLIVKIADLVRNKKIEGIKGIRDESTTHEDIRVVIDLKGGSHPQKVLNHIYKHTPLEDTFHFNMVALVDGVPQTLSLKTILEEFIKHRREVIVRRTKYDLAKAEDREHILLGLKKALDHIDEIIKLIRASKDQAEAKVNLMKKFKFSDRQADAILAMRLAQLANLERQKIEDELAAIQELIAKLRALLASEKKIFALVKKELVDVREKYGDERNTKVMPGGVKNISIEDLIPDVENVLVITSGGYIKRTSPDEFKRQKRGGVGVVDLKSKDEDVVERMLTATLHNDILFFTSNGRVFQTKMYDLPEGRRATKGKSIMNFLSLETDEQVTAVLAMTKEVKAKDRCVVMVTEQGTVKKVEAESFHDVRRSGIIAINLSEGDKLISARFIAEGDDVFVATLLGQSIRFSEADVRAMGRTAGGVRAVKLADGDHVVSAGVIKANEESQWVLVVTELGYGKRTLASEYKTQGRGGSGIKTAKLSKKTGELVGARVITVEDEEIVIITQKSQVIRIGLKEINELGRQTQGVRVMKLRSGDKLASVIKL